MATKVLSAADLSFALGEALKQAGGFPINLAVAVVPDERLGWRAVVKVRVPQVRRANLMERLGGIERELRLQYSLVAG